MNREDTTQTGHLLGPACDLSKQATPERDLLPVACTITRLIMHAALTWSSICVTVRVHLYQCQVWYVFNLQDSTKDLANVVHPAIIHTDLPQFFLDHLTHDLDVLSQVLGTSTDDAALIIHIILKGMHDFPQSGVLKSY